MLLNAHAGTKYGIPFPVLVRASFGVHGANLPAAASRPGGLRLVRYSDLDRRPGDRLDAGRLMARDGRSPVTVWVCFFAFWLLNMFVIWRGIETIRILEGIGAPFMLTVGLLLLLVDHPQSGRARPGPQRAQQVSNQRGVLRFFVPSLTAMVGFWSTVALNIPDFTRYATSQRAQALGQALGLAHRDDALFVHRRGRHLGVGRAVRSRRSGIRWC